LVQLCELLGFRAETIQFFLSRLCIQIGDKSHDNQCSQAAPQFSPSHSILPFSEIAITTALFLALSA
jgi:hypothetical protein